MTFITGHQQFNTGRTHFKKGEHTSVSTEFKKGMTPWNKGKKIGVSPRKGIKLPSEIRDKIKQGMTEEGKERLRKRMIGNKLGIERKWSSCRRSQYREMFRGDKSHFWKGGITKEHELIRQSFRYREWRSAVFERDNYTCQMCRQSRSGLLQADHIKPFALYPKLRFEITNGRTLCVDCHKTTDTYGWKIYNGIYKEITK